MTGTTRCFSNEVWETFEERMERVIKGTAEAYRAEAELEYLRIVPPTVNDEAVVSIAQKSAVAVLVRIASHPIPATTAAKTSPTSCRGCREQSHCWEPETRPAEPFGQTIPAISGVDEAQLLKGCHALCAGGNGFQRQ